MSEENQELELEYIVPNRAVPLTVVESIPINQNWDEIEQAINKNYDLASQVENKIDISEKGVEGGVATLDINNKLVSDQIPDEAKGHVYEVDNLSEQLALNAFTGDICVRRDVGKSFALKLDSPSNASSWVEIASINSGGEIGANPCYNRMIQASDWEEENGKNIFYINIDNLEHGQGNTKYLIVNIKNNLGQNIICDYIIDENGLVTIYSDVPFEASVIISNLSGNCDNASYIPYSIIRGYQLNGIPSFISYSLHTISISTVVPLVVMDGFNIVRNIKTAADLDLDAEELTDGHYILFVDSANIQDNHLNLITHLSYGQYLGLHKELPSGGKEGDRCYVIYDKSYEFINGGWTAKAFVPIGEYLVKNGNIVNAKSYNFMQNDIDVNYASHTMDYLLGDIITGLDINFDDNLIVQPGNCLVGSKIVKIDSPIVKDYNSNWEEGSGLGCLDPNNLETQEIYEVVKDGSIYYTEQAGEINGYAEAGVEIYYDQELSRYYKDAEEDEFLYNGEYILDSTQVTGWGDILLISHNKFDVADIFLTYNKSPELPDGYNQYRRIGYFHRNENLEFKREKQIKDINYLYQPEIIETQISSEVTNIPIDMPQDVEVTFSYRLEEAQPLTFYYDGIEIYEEYSKNNTLTLPCYGKNLEIKGEQEVTIGIKVLGYRDRREL